ncbi:MAG: hypothetical protein LBO79_02885 [Zoogloeaceae bacterium]|jgi:hypothetical protein|nr:hypothetical protein [Zoogloeaceae bacterium]
MHDEKTLHLELPLPHPHNDLEIDILRLRAALGQLDAHLSGIDALLSVDNEDLDTLHEIVEAVKLAHEDIAALNALVESEVAQSISGVKDDIAALQTLTPLIYAGL